MPCKGYHKKNPRNCTVTVYLTEEEYETLCKMRDETGRSFSELIRSGLRTLWDASSKEAESVDFKEAKHEI